jgi:hypothetical protein
VEIDEVSDPWLLLALTHGSAGGVDAPDLLAVRDAVLAIGGTVARVVQPFRLRGARAPGSAVKQDEAWVALIAELRRRYPGLPLVQGGRSNGARVACRTARAVGADGVIALAFPLHPPGKPERSRADELRAAETAGDLTARHVLTRNGDAGKREITTRSDPRSRSEVAERRVLVINGDRDPFGVPDARDAGRLVVLPGEGHDLKKDPARVGEEVTAWLLEIRRRCWPDQ